MSENGFLQAFNSLYVFLALQKFSTSGFPEGLFDGEQDKSLSGQKFE